MKELFSGVALGKNFNAKNRLVRSSTWEGLCDCDGYVTPALCKMYEELAQGGVGTIVTGITYVERGDQPSRNMMGLDDDCFIPNCKKLPTPHVLLFRSGQKCAGNGVPAHFLPSPAVMGITH